MSASKNSALCGPGHRRANRRVRALVLAAWIAATGMLVLPQVVEARGAVGGSGGRMATASIGAANLGAGNRPSQLPAGSGNEWPGRRPDPPDRGNDGWGWYAGYAYGTSGDDDRDVPDDRDIDVDGAIAAAAAAAAAAATAAVAAPPAAGTVVYQLEPGCSTVERNGAYYRYCGGVYYQEQLGGDRIAYMVVNP